MKLVDTEIRRALDSGVWKSYRDGEPIGSADLQIGPNSVDVTLGDKILNVYPQHWIDTKKSNSFTTPITSERERNGQGGFFLRPRQLYLASVRESFDCCAPLWIPEPWRYVSGDEDFDLTEAERYFAPMIDGRSTLARVGLSVHQTAGFGDFGFGGQHAAFTLELTCVLPIVLYPGMRIAQVSFDALCGVPTQRYSGAYTKQTGPHPAVLGEGRI